MPQESLQALYNSVSENYDVGTFDTFTQKMQDPTKRKAFYGAISNEFDLPEYEQFEAKVSTTAPAINPQDVFIDPDEDLIEESSFKQNIYDSVKQQENSIAKNNPYGVNMPRKKSNAEKIFNLGGSLMADSQTLLEFKDMKSGMKVGEDIIDNILGVSKNSPAKFYSNYSGLPEDSPEVKSFVSIFNKRNKETQPKQETNLDRIIKALEYGKDNPQYVMKAASSPDPVESLSRGLPKFVMGISTSELLKKPKQEFDGIPTKEAQEKLDKEKARLNLPFDATEEDFQKYYNKRIFQKEVAKLEKKGLTKRDAYRKVGRFGTPPSVIDLAMEKSITGAAFRIAGLEQKTMLDEYPPNQLEEIVSGAFSMIMPLDAALFKGGGSLGKIKTVGKAADKAAMLIAKNTNMPLRTARVYMKSIIPRVTGGAGGFAAFDSGRSIVDQIEFTGTVDPIEVAEHTMKGLLTGGSVSFLGGVGSFAGKKLQKAVGAPVSKQATAKETLGFVGEVFGLAEVPALLEGKDATFEDYQNAAGMIIGLKVLKSLEPKAGTALRDNVANEVERIVKETGKPLHVVANEVVGRPLRTAMELAMEGKTPEKSVREQITEYEVAEKTKKPIEPGVNRAEAVVKEAETIDQLKNQGFSQVEAEQRAKTVLRDAGVKTEDILRAEAESPTKTNERVQLNQQVRRLSDKMSELERANAEQRILDDLQMQIDAKVIRLNEMGVGEAEINRALEPKTTPSTKEVQLQMRRRDRAEQERLDKTLQERDILNRPFEPDPMREVPLHPADAGRRAVAEIQTIETAPPTPKTKPTGPTVKKKKLTGIDNKGYVKDHNIKTGDQVYVNESGYLGTVKGFKRGKDSNVVTIENERGRQNLTDRNLFTPKEVYEEGVRRRNTKPVSELEGLKRVQGFMLQRELANFDATLKANEARLKNPNLTETQTERIKQSIQKAKELKRNTQDDARAQGIELQAFMGIPNLRQLRQLFGSERVRPRTLRDVELDRVYNNAMQRLDRETPREEIKISTTPSEQPSRERGGMAKIFSWFSGDMVQRVRDMGTETSQRAAELARKSIDTEKKVYGQLSGELDIVLKSAGTPFFTQKGQAVKGLQKFVNIEINGNLVKVSRLHAAIEGKIKVKGKELEIVNEVRNLIEKRGRIFEENNIMQEGPDGEVRPFKVTGREIAPRIMTGDFYRILELGEGHNSFKKLVRNFSEATGQSQEAVKEYFSELSQNIKGVTNAGEQLPTRTTQAEHSRKWKDIPHAIKIGKDIVPIVEYRIYEYAKRLAETGSSRVGVATTFGQEIAGTSIINEMRQQIAKEMNGDPIVFHEMIRSLSSTPVEPSFRESGLGATGYASKATRALNSSLNFVKNTTLSGSFFPNITEPLGNVRKHVGMPTLLKSIFQITTSPKAVRSALEAQGAITIDIANLSIDPQRPYSSLVRGVNDIQRRGFGFHYINEFQEVLASQSYAQKVQRFKDGKGKSKDIQLLREMDYSEADARLIVSGQAPEGLYDALVRRAPAYLTGGAQRKGEQSRIEHNKWYNGLTAFQTYSNMKNRSLVRAAKVSYERGLKEAWQEGNHQKFVDASRLGISEVLGTGVAGMTTQFILAGVYGGGDNMKIKWNEVVENPFGFMLESYMYSAVGGVMGSIVQSTVDGKLKDNFLELSFPISVILEVEKAVNEKGKYTYLEGMDKVRAVASRYFPANKALNTLLVATGFGNEQAQKDNNAIKGYYRWKFKNKYGGSYTGNPDEDQKTFRLNMKKAYDSLKNQEDWETIDGHVMKALDLTNKDDKSAVMSILGKRLLSKSKLAPGKSNETYEERLEELRRNIGDEAYERLELHDGMLEDYASFWK
tara:strand:+ start:116 stop:5650 length:5535 start_codon:yes stop_codon:yes gene_type:complete